MPHPHTNKTCKMPKLPTEHNFLDLSDYGRPIARQIASRLKHTKITPIDVTLVFILSGLVAIYCILNNQFWAALFFLIVKSILDAADGELARQKNTPSYTGRYLDSVADIALNLLILLSICHVTQGQLVLTLLAFVGMQLQGTLYNYYHVILRNNNNGDTTSRIFEIAPPSALPGEKQSHVNILFAIYYFCYGLFDKFIYQLDKGASNDVYLPSWLMTMVSVFGLGFQLLIIGVLLSLGFATYILPFFIFSSLFIFVFILIRKKLNANN